MFVMMLYLIWDRFCIKMQSITCHLGPFYCCLRIWIRLQRVTHNCTEHSLQRPTYKIPFRDKSLLYHTLWLNSSVGKIRSINKQPEHTQDLIQSHSYFHFPWYYIPHECGAESFFLRGSSCTFLEGTEYQTWKRHKGVLHSGLEVGRWV